MQQPSPAVTERMRGAPLPSGLPKPVHGIHSYSGQGQALYLYCNILWQRFM